MHRPPAPRVPHRLLAISLAWTLGGLLAAGEVRAQASVGADAPALALQAERDAKAGRYEAAIGAYERAWELSPDPAYLYNLGVLVLLGRDDPEAAWGFASRYADAVRSEEGRRDARVLLKRIEEPLARTHGFLVLSVTPPGAEVYLDRVTTAGRLQRSEVWVRAGSHRILAEAQGFEPGDRALEVRAGSRTDVRLDLTPRVARAPVENPVPTVDPMKVGTRPPPTPAPATAPRRKGLGHRLGWGLMGTGLGVGAVATVLYGLSWARQQDGKDPFPMGYWAYALWGVGGALLISGITVYVELDDTHAASLVPAGPGGPGLTAMIPW